MLAHPRAAKRQRRFLSIATIGELKEVGLFGLEAFHPEQNPQEQAQIREIGRKLGLKLTGSSDFHGYGKANSLGQCLTDPEVFSEICALGGGEIVRP